MLANVINRYKESGSVTKVNLSLDTIFHLLSNERRRLVIQTLEETGALDKSELSTQVAERENQIHRDVMHSDTRKCVAIALHQSHLPKLEDTDVIERTHNEVRLGPNAKPLLDVIESVE